jgi:hypothetical protein
MNSADQPQSPQAESNRFANLYYVAAIARLDTLKQLLVEIDSAGGIENAKRPLADAMQIAQDIAENLRHSHHALKRARRDAGA